MCLRWGMDTKGATNLSELRVLLQNVMIRRLKNEVLTQLPAKRRQKIALPKQSGAEAEMLQRKLEENSRLQKISTNEALTEAERAKADRASQQLLTEMYSITGLSFTMYYKWI